MVIESLKLSAEIECWPLKAPFRITGYTWEKVEVLVVSLEVEGHVGRGEAAGVYYKGDRPQTMLKQVEALRETIESRISRAALQILLSPGGARNAIDCALWDLESKLSGQAAWKGAGLDKPKPILETFTCGADTPDAMASAALAYPDARAIKLKLTGERVDADRVQAVRAARPNVWLSVDANQGFTRASLEWLMPVLLDARVAMIEQPFPIEQRFLLHGLESPIPLAADEDVQSLSDLAELAGLVNIINVKLDKCGGLTEGLAMVREARRLGLETMVGNMLGTSLAMAPGFLLGQVCSVVDLDGPTFLTSDREDSVQFKDGFISCPEKLWGHPEE